MTGREKLLVLIALVTVGWGFGYYWWYEPAGQSLKKMEEQIITYETVLSSEQGKEVPAQLQSYHTRQQEQAEQVPGPRAVVALLEQLNIWAEQTGIRLTRFGLEKESRSAEALPYQTYKLIVSGKFTEILAFIKQLEASKRLLTLEEVIIFNPPAYPEVEAVPLSPSIGARAEAEKVRAEIYFSTGIDD
ncbi:MAG: type 4a pilus biogenesis protein PilO [Syntrophomonadaceae bacterium]|nr:type 4a pilus biogenesis protein PilO [Syntrophomonadaceae bacterium]